MKIANIDLTKQVFIIAELSANHNNDINIAKQAIIEAKKAGADALKLQTYTADSLTLNVQKEAFKAGDIWSDEYLYDLYKRAAMPYKWYDELFTLAKEVGIILFSSPFDKEGVDLLESFDTPAYKIASFEITDIPLIRYSASKQKPLIISCGVASIEDIELALQTCYEENNHNIILLKCTSSYPAPDKKMNLKTITDMQQRFKHPIGLSDHSLGDEAVIASIALGARVIEKHFTIDKSLPTPDKDFSVDPDELKTLVQSIRRVEKMIGNISYGGDKKYARSLFTCKPIKKGEIFCSENIKSVRPNIGIHPKYYDFFLGKKALRDYEEAEPLTQKDLEMYQ